MYEEKRMVWQSAKLNFSKYTSGGVARHWAAHLCIAMHGTTLQVSSENPKIFMHSCIIKAIYIVYR